MALYRRILLLRRLSHLHPSPAPAVCSSPPPTLAGLPTTPTGRRHFAFSSAEEAAAERRRRKRRMRIEPPLNALRRSPAPQDPNAPRLPDTTAKLVGPRLSLHNRVQSLIRSGDLDGASVAARAAVSSRVRPTVFTCNAVFAAMVRAGRHDDAAALFDFFFRRSDIVPNIVSYNYLILSHCEAGRVDTAMQVYRDMLASAPFNPSAITYRHLTKGLVAAGRIRDAHDLLREMLLPDRNAGADSLVYSNLIAGYIDLDDWGRAFELFNELAERCAVYDGVVHTTFMEGYWKQGKDKEAMDNYQSLLERGFKMTPATCNVLLETLFKHGKHKEANDLWYTTIDNHNPPSFSGINAESYSVMVNQCFREGKFKEAIEVFHRQPRKNVQMDVGCFNNIIGKLCENGMLVEAEKLFEEMETKSVLPDVYTYTYLVDSCFKEGRVEDTMQYFYKMADGREHGPKFNIGFFNRMFEGLTEAGRIDDALEVYGRMPDKEIKPNVTTFEILVKALCKEGDLDQARCLVMDMARGGIVPPPLFRESVVDFFNKAGRQEEIEKAFEEKPVPTPQPRTEYPLRTDYSSRNAPGAAQVKQPGFSSAPAVIPGFGYSQPQQSTFSNNQNQQPEFGSSRSWNSGFGAPQAQPGYGAPEPVQAVVGSSDSQLQQSTFSNNQQFGSSHSWNSGFGAPQAQPGYGAPQPVQAVLGSSYSQPQQSTFSNKQNHQPEFGSSHSCNSGFGAPQAQPGYGAPQPVQAVVGSSQLQRPQFGASQGVPGYSNIGNQHGQYGSPHGEPKFSNHPPKVGYGGQLPQSGYRFEPQKEQIGVGSRVAPPAYVASNQHSYGTHRSSSGYGSTQGQLGYGGPQAQSHESQIPHHHASFGMSHIQNNNGFYRYNPGYRSSNGLQGSDAPHGDSETASSKDHQETPEDGQQVAFLKA